MWLLGTSTHAAAAVDALVARLESGRAEDVLGSLHEADTLRGGVFAGRGWGRKQRALRLRSVAVTLIDNGAWPSVALQPLFKPRPFSRRPEEEPRDGEEAAWTAVQELFSEGLLAGSLLSM